MEIRIKRKNGTRETRDIQSVEELRKGLSGKDSVSLDGGVTFEQLRRLNDDDVRRVLVLPLDQTAKPAESIPVREPGPVASGSPSGPVPQRLPPPIPPDKATGAASARIEAQLRRLEEEQSALGSAVQGLQQVVDGAAIRLAIDENLSRELAKFSSDLDVFRSRVVSDVGGARAEVDKAIEDLRWQEDELKTTSEERRKFIARYKPGTVEELEQRLSSVRSQLEEAEKRETQLKIKLDRKELELRSVQAPGHVVSRQELEERELRLDEKQRALEDHVLLQQQRDALQHRVNELEPLRATYERVQKSVQQDEALRRENEQLLIARDEAEARAEAAKASLRVAEERIERLSRSLQQSRDTVRAQVEKLDTTEVARAQVADELQRLQSSIEAMRTAASEQLREAESLRQRRAAELLETENQRRAAMAGVEAQRQRHQAHYDAWEADLAARESSIEARMQSLAEERLDQQLRTLRDDAASVPALRKWIASLEAELVRACDERNEFISRRAALEHEYDGLLRRTEAIREELEVKEPELHGVRKQLAEESRVQAVRLKEFADAQELAKRELEHLREERRRIEERTTDPVARLAPVRRLWEERRPSLLPPMSETEWLADLEERIEDAGFHFSKRLVYAFHTSLKIADWAPLTALAGVSGTGKSELPRLYAQLGGLRFLSVPVQPNWDSPQDLFGFFNYMDGRYRPTEFLRALDQSQRPPSENGFNDGMLLVLLDEMNRARFELYFSELLIRLESRRGAATDRERVIKVDLGAGVDEHNITLGQNLLFVGTMNEDESTHSLSDMVLDRGNVLTFPRPEHLHRRAVTKPIQRRVEALTLETWQRWIHSPSELMEEAKNRVAQTLGSVNEALSKVNRAIGHRVLQAVEAYVVNYPGVAAGGAEAWKPALEDQLAQKVMPKLRGIELDSQSGKQCIEQIRNVLGEFSLVQDFNRSLSLSQGAFIWSSSRYLSGDNG